MPTIKKEFEDALSRFAAESEASTYPAIFGAMVKSAKWGDLAIRVAAQLNLTAEPICELVLQSFLFAGFPRCINGLAAFHEHYAPQANREPSSRTSDTDLQEFRRRGESLFRTIYGPHADIVLEALDQFHGQLKDWILVDAYGKILSRPGLGAKERELCAVTALLVSDDTRQLSSHIRGAIHCGAEAEEIQSAIQSVRLLVNPEQIQLGLDVLNKIRP